MIRRSLSRALVIVTMLTLALPWVALADNVNNDVANDVDGNAIESVTAGGTGASVGFKLVETKDSEIGEATKTCNVTSMDKLTLTWPSLATGITASPTFLEFAECDPNGFQYVTFSAASTVAAGDYTITATLSSTAGFTNNTSFILRVGASSSNNNNNGCTTPAVPTFTSPSSVPTTGWFTTAPTLAASGTNVEYATQTSLGGVLGTKSSFSSTAPSLGQGTTIVYARSVDGTCVSGETSATIRVDSTAPALNVSAPSGTHDLCTAGIPTPATFNPSDSSLTHDTSGVNSDPLKTYINTTPPSTASGAGTYNWNARAEDNATNAATATGSYRVAYGSAMTFPLSPINADGLSRFKLGSTVPVKFTLSCNGASIDNAIASLTVKKKDNTANPGVDEAISTAASTTGNLFRYSADGAQYIFNLSTKLGYEQVDPTTSAKTTVSFSTGSWILQVNLDDGTFRQIEIQLVK